MAFSEEEIRKFLSEGKSVDEIASLEAQSETPALPPAPEGSQEEPQGWGGMLLDAITPPIVKDLRYFKKVGDAYASKDPKKVEALFNNKQAKEAFQSGTQEMLRHPVTSTIMPELNMIPGVSTAEGFASDVVRGDLQSPGTYAKQLGVEAAGLGVGAGLGYGAGKVAGGLANRSLKREAREAFNTPEGRAAISYAEAAGFLDEPEARAAYMAGKYDSPYFQKAIDLAQNEARLSKGQQVEGSDAILSYAFKQPRSSAPGTPRVTAENLNKAAPNILNSKIFHTADDAPFNPITGTFEGVPSRPTGTARILDKANGAIKETIGARRTAVTDLDSALVEINKTPSESPKIRGIMFVSDVSPMLNDLKELIEKKKEFLLSLPEGEAMQDVMDKLEASMNNLTTKTGGDRFKNMIGPPGGYEKGEISLSEALSIIEDMNSIRRTIGEFNTRAVAHGFVGDIKSFADEGAKLIALKETQSAMQAALEAKAKEVLGRSRGLTGYYDFSERLSLYTDKTLPTMNRNIGDFHELIEGAGDYLNTANRAVVASEPGRMITEARDITDTAIRARKEGVAASALRAGRNVFSSSVPPSEAQMRSDVIQRMYSSPIAQVVDGLLIREKPVPILSRNFEKIKLSKDAMGELERRAIMLGVLPSMGILNSLPEPQQSEVHSLVIQAMPNATENAPGNFNLKDNKFQNPAELHYHMQAGLRLPLEHQARVLSAAYDGGEYAPLDNREEKSPVAPPLPPAIDISQLNTALSPTLSGLNNDRFEVATGSLSDMLSQLETAKDLHELN